MVQPFLIYSDWGLFALRLAVGFVLVRHGLPKLRDLKGTARWMGSVGFRPGGFWAIIVGALEFFGGGLIILGFLVQAISLLVAAQFVVILLTVARKKTWDDKEKDLLILAAALALAVLGAGSMSLESYWGWVLY